MIARCTSNALVAALLMLTASGCFERLPGRPDPASPPVLPSEQTDFTVLFRENCAGCHGVEGRLGPAPPLNDPLFLAIVPEEVLLQVITGGRPETPMPAFARHLAGSLTEEQIKILAAGLKKHWKSDAGVSDVPAYTLATSGQPSAGQIERGEKLFASACATCHGEAGLGSDDNSPPGRVNDPALLNVMSDQALRRIIITGRPDLGMPTYAESAGRGDDFKPLTSENINDLVALMAHWRQVPQSVAANTAGR